MAESTIIIDATIGGASTNSFVDLPEAELLIHARPFHADWDAINGVEADDIKKAALVWATRILSNYCWKGLIASQTQALPFPRSGLYDNDAREYASDAYPEWLTVATTELAFFMATDDRLGDSGTEGFSKIKIDKLEFTVDPNDRTEIIPDYIIDAISRWMETGDEGGFTVSRA